MRRIVNLVMSALGAFVIGSLFFAQAHAADCRYAGTWVSGDGDTMILGGIKGPKKVGSYKGLGSTNPYRWVVLNIDGVYRVERTIGTIFHYKGKDQLGNDWDESLQMTVDMTSAPTEIRLKWPALPDVQVFRLQQRASAC
jgi:hypothetical protein